MNEEYELINKDNKVVDADFKIVKEDEFTEFTD
jgi:hypothetical protein